MKLVYYNMISLSCVLPQMLAAMLPLNAVHQSYWSLGKFGIRDVIRVSCLASISVGVGCKCHMMQSLGASYMCITATRSGQYRVDCHPVIPIEFSDFLITNATSIATITTLMIKQASNTILFSHSLLCTWKNNISRIEIIPFTKKNNALDLNWVHTI